MSADFPRPLSRRHKARLVDEGRKRLEAGLGPRFRVSVPARHRHVSILCRRCLREWTYGRHDLLKPETLFFYRKHRCEARQLRALAKSRTDLKKKALLP